MAGRLTNLQVLRALAAIVVVASHAAHESIGMAARLGAPAIFGEDSRWSAAVDVFFVMSGFILAFTSFEAFGQRGAPRRFFMRRLIRAVPLYWLLTTLVLVGAVLAPSLLNVPISGVGQVLASYLFWPYPRGAGEIRPVLALGWTMNLEFFFYALLAACLALPRRWGLAAAAGTLTGVAALGLSTPGLPAPLAFWGSALTLDFVLGIAIAAAFKAGAQLSAGGAGLLAAAALAAILASSATDPNRIEWFFAMSLPAACLVAAAVLAPQFEPANRLGRFGVLLGDACYSIYLLQPFVLRPAAVAWVALVGAQASLWAFMAIGVAAALAAGLACFLLIEAPLTAALNRRLKAWESRREARGATLQPAE